MYCLSFPGIGRLWSDVWVLLKENEMRFGRKIIIICLVMSFMSVLISSRRTSLKA